MLSLGKSFNRNYNLRIPFYGGFYNIGIFFNDNSTFLLFSVNSDFSESKHNLADNIKVNMFKNIESSKFCETFLNLHNYQGVNLDIINQFKTNNVFKNIANNVKSNYDDQYKAYMLALNWSWSDLKTYISSLDETKKQEFINSLKTVYQSLNSTDEETSQDLYESKLYRTGR